MSHWNTRPGRIRRKELCAKYKIGDSKFWREWHTNEQLMKLLDRQYEQHGRSRQMTFGQAEVNQHYKQYVAELNALPPAPQGGPQSERLKRACIRVRCHKLINVACKYCPHCGTEQRK